MQGFNSYSPVSARMLLYPLILCQLIFPLMDSFLTFGLSWNTITFTLLSYLNARGYLKISVRFASSGLRGLSIQAPLNKSPNLSTWIWIRVLVS